ncbi:MAG: TonB-dependent receptor, partial [Chitinophagaceae bacterium]|nr:TonB-dependent receptor [Chitinophagaceae bacterium]
RDDDPQPTGNAALENKLYEVGDKNAANRQTTVTIAGYVRDAKTGEPVAGASVYINRSGFGATTDQYGYYSLSLPKGRHVLFIQSLGMSDTRRQVLLHGDGKLNIDLLSKVMTLKNITISAQKINNIKGTQMSVQKIDIKTIKQVPVVFGEADLLRVVTTLPGVKTVGEASTGLNVRGGAADQNLILYNDATIYNPSHFFGMFSALNTEVVKDVELYKSSVPVRYGGRLSSVLNITSREGNKKKMAGTAGVGLLTSRLELEGPLVKDKSSFILAGRTTYANWLLNLLPDEYKNSKASFYDLNLNVNHEINRKNTLYLTGYMSNDRFNLSSDTLFGYGNKNVSLKWKHIFTNKLTSISSAGYDSYNYYTSSDHRPENGYKLSFAINQAYFRTHFNYFLNNQHTFDFGLNTLHYKLQPGSYQPYGNESLVIPETISPEQALESAVYFSDKYKLNSFSIDAGVRYSLFNYLGPQTVNKYAPGLPITETNNIGTENFRKSSIVKTYGGPEIRLSLVYLFNDSFSIKAAYNTQRQYIHSISNTAAMSPTDIWKLSDPNIKPQFGSQISFGLYKNFKSNTIEASVEAYYKTIENYLDYKSGAKLVMNPHLETDVLGTKGKAYGVEFLLRKTAGKLNGWISYTWSRILLKADNPMAGETINEGNFYPANYDKPHDVTLISNYRFNHRFSVSFNATYNTGRPITLPIGVFYYAGGQRTLYTNRNAYRIPDYFRADFSMNIDGNHKVNQIFHSSWTFGVYNITGRRNPYSVYYVSENGVINGYKLSVFGNAIPYVNFNIRF